MRASDSPAAAPTNPGGKEEVRSVGDEAVDRARSRAGRGFRSALDRKRGDASGGGQDVASAAALAGWFRSEAMAGASPTAPARSPGVGAASAVDRVLIGSSSEGAQARIRIGAGALAGAEIQLSTSATGRAVEAQLLTHVASSRQTLAVVLDEIRSRLRERGIILSPKAPPVPRTRDVGGGDDGRGRARAGEPTGERP